MTELNIKKEIGKRIFESRKAKGLTLKDLGELAGGLKQTRLTNWEQGTRTPGPEEIKWLAQALDVSPAYLMCLTDENTSQNVRNSNQLIPLLDHKQAYDFQEGKNTLEVPYFSVSTSLLPQLSSDAFALNMLNDSMVPEFRPSDVLVVDPTQLPKPGDYVVVNMIGETEVIICQYKKLSYISTNFELLTLNDNWPNIRMEEGLEIKIIGTVVQSIRGYGHKNSLQQLSMGLSQEGIE